MKRNGGELLIQSLVALGASKSFGIPGESYLAALDALHDTKGVLDFVLCRNEGGASFMASAYGKLTGTPGICFVTRGPGATNASIGVHTAKQDSSPMLLFVGQVAADVKGREAFQELDYKAVFGSMAKWAVEIDHIERIPEIVSRAWCVATTGRPGPVVIALPEDMLTSTTDVEPLKCPVTFDEPEPSQASLDCVAELLSHSRQPVILYGGGSWNESGSSALKAFAEQSNIPVVAAFRYQDRFDNYSNVFCGELGVGTPAWLNEMIQAADVVLAINVRFGEVTTNGYQLFDLHGSAQKLIHVHISELELGKIYRPDLAIHAGPNAFARSLKPVKGAWDGWRAEARSNYVAGFSAPEQPSPVDMVKVSAYLRDRLPQDVVLTNGAGNFTIWPGKFFQYGEKARLLAPQSGAMGYGLPAAIAAKIAFPQRTVICFAGDGDFQMNLQELATAKQYGAQPIILVLNNGIYGTIRAHQECNYPGRVSGTTMTENPDFVALGQAYGFYAEYVENTDAFQAAFERAMESETGAVLELNISPEAITPRQSLSQMREAALAKKDLI
ncbi:thiamine pyrophosphate-binding protein [Vibrio natriegens]|uniref:thiamine pyrophosphate-dependent enzyme n=1 Tax=Vibrio natriegens TaxID=691 RepID=UPI0008044C44|nr:thiamine pyrophosphate-dependent enzyme [Vibrio natriegens]ANQ24689.1 thiamine pyrophosphate-binding protein [Vibrio natriegens]